MSEKMKADSLEIVSTACELYAKDYMALSKLIKISMDKNHGSMWHVVVGENFSVELEYEPGTLMSLCYGGTLAICIWRT
ncbi:dynein light chain 4, axonemal-like [Sipha flava]|uniref:Dynein light chain 4, axonemal-like n=1 Tax=Sipha flava TaxID=143950 RepID=A0A8B8GHV9_9HEMI|nr:dynein light chain 4, axonemal-like [Sipha flava]